MARRDGSPADRRFSHFRCEEATITDVNRDRWTVTVDTRHTAKTVPDVQVGSPYLHPEGEGVYSMPDVGATCYLAWPSDNTPPWVMAFKGDANVVASADGNPIRMTSEDGGSTSDVSFSSRRPRMNPGDTAITTRDGNHLIVRRGGVVEIGATPIAKRLYLPIANYIKDFAENYAMHMLGGDLEWVVARSEEDPSGNAPATWTLQLNEFAQDEKATVRIRHMPPVGSGSKSAWEIDVAPQGINRDTGEVTGAKYRLSVTIDGDQIEMISASREVTIDGDDDLTVGGDQSISVGGDHLLEAGGKAEILATGDAVLGGAGVKLGSRLATSPAMLGDEFLIWVASAQWLVVGSVATLSPASLAGLQRVLSRKVSLE